MTNFEVILNALNSMTQESAVAFKGEMCRVGNVFSGIKKECSEEQIKELGKSLEAASGCIKGLAKEIDESDFLGTDDDDLFAMFFFQSILKQLS